MAPKFGPPLRFAYCLVDSSKRAFRIAVNALQLNLLSSFFKQLLEIERRNSGIERMFFRPNENSKAFSLLKARLSSTTKKQKMRIKNLIIFEHVNLDC